MNEAFTVNAFTCLFLAALLLSSGTRLWLAVRQTRHVLAHRDAVPESFAGTIPLAAHQKAADYTVSKVRLQMAEIGFDALVLLVLTTGGLVQWISTQWEQVFARDSIAHGAALILTVFSLVAAIGLPTPLPRSE